MTRRATIAVLGCLAASISAASASPIPDWTADLPADGGRVDRPPGLTEMDAWLLGADGQAAVRLRQRPRRRCFTRAHGRRCLVRYSRRSVATGYDTTRHGARVYGWAR